MYEETPLYRYFIAKDTYFPDDGEIVYFYTNSTDIDFYSEES